MPIRKWTKLLIEAQHDDWGSGFYNVQTNTNVSEEGMAHVALIIDNCKAFNFCQKIPNDVWEDSDAMEAFIDTWDSQYGIFYDDGWLRYLWVKEGNSSMLAGSSSPQVLEKAWNDGVIQNLYQYFQVTMSYWDAAGNIPGMSSHVQPPEEYSPGQIPPLIEDWFESIAGEDEVNDIRRRAGLK